jgi:hypothetical protein
MPMDLRWLLLDGPTLEIKDPPDRAAEDAFPGVKLDANRTLEKRRKSNMFDLLNALVSLMVGWLVGWLSVRYEPSFQLDVRGSR